MIRFSALLFSLAMAAFPAAGFDPVNTAKDAVADFEAWAERHGVKEAAIVIAYEGDIVAKGEFNRTIMDAAKVASLSKAITAVCTLKALDQADVHFFTPLSAIIPDLLAKYPPRDTRFQDIKVSQLINQTSGITTRYHRNIEVLRTFGKENKAWQLSKIVQDPLSDAPDAAGYHYANANYLVLGLVIEALTDEDYETYCIREIMEPAGVTTARLSETWKVMSSWGGWAISTEDYLRFVEHWFGGDNEVNRPGGFFLPAADSGRGRTYGAGIAMRQRGQTVDAWHKGAWLWNGRIKDEFGATFGLWANGFSVVATYSDSAFRGAVSDEIDSLIYRSLHPE